MSRRMVDDIIRILDGIKKLDNWPKALFTIIAEYAIPISTSFARKDINSTNKFDLSTSKINKNYNFKYNDQLCNNYNKIVIVPEDDCDENSEIISNVYNEFEVTIIHNNKYAKYENERKHFSKNVEEFINKFNYYNKNK